MFFGSAFDIIFSVFPILFTIVFILAIISFIRNFIRNSSAPILTEKVRVVSKRTQVNHVHHHPTENTTHVTSSTTYYITFENEAGQRFELRVGPNDYGLIVEGDEGLVTYQGEWFKKFERTI